MYREGWRRAEADLAHSSLKPRRVSSSEFKRAAEESGSTFPHVFQISADCCRDLEERETHNLRGTGELAKPVADVANLASGAGLDPTEERSQTKDSLVDSTPNLATELGRNAALEFYKQLWTTQDWKCSDASLARAARVDVSDMSRWKRGLLPDGSDKKMRIEEALRENTEPVRAPSHDSDE